MPRLLLSLFLTGLFLGAGPCLLSCGPLLVSYIAATKETSWAGLKTYCLFSLARLIVYLFFGILVGFCGQQILYRFFDSLSLKILFFAFGVFLLILGFLIVIEKFSIHKRCMELHQLFLKPKDTKNIILFGLIVSFLPCLPLFAVLGYIALLADHWSKGLLCMAAFGIGTILSPMILLSFVAGGASHFLKTHEKVLRLLKILCGAVLVYLGVQLMFLAKAYSFPKIYF